MSVELKQRIDGLEFQNRRLEARARTLASVVGATAGVGLWTFVFAFDGMSHQALTLAAIGTGVLGAIAGWKFG